ncbi:MAG: response regulator [Deltaproteobacteria bacterium]|uniref:Response regulator n=1 Tax=Candidatus Zymogenus saltonus TaxID=2844893 RepID=A0A9D8PP44_9DELT|nr:response regulator [Candidatus Zymogenus saltonus]
MKSKILIVDDLRFFLDVQRSMLSQVDCDILTARSGIEALKIIKKSKPQLVLLDYEMPDLNGDKACEILKKDPRYKDIPIIITSSKAGKEAKLKCMGAGADCYLTKPVDQKELVEAVSKLLKVRSSLYYPRAAMRGEVYVKFNDEVDKYLSVDISVTGIFLESTDPLIPNDVVTLHFTIPMPKRDVRTQGRVSRILTIEDMENFGVFPGMAVEFLNLDLEDRRYIEQYIDNALKMRKHDLLDNNHNIHFI